MTFRPFWVGISQFWSGRLGLWERAFHIQGRTREIFCKYKEYSLPQWNLLFSSFVGLYLLQLVLALGLERLNRDHQQQQGVRVPKGFEDFMDEQKMKQTMAYSGERSRFGSTHLVFSELFFLGLILWGFFPSLDNLLTRLSWNSVLTGLWFFMIPGFFNALLDLPFDYYQAFALKKNAVQPVRPSKFGFWIT